LLQEPTLEWRRVLCDENLTHSNIVAMQKALADKGIYSGPVDGIIGAGTISAVNQFAKSRNLPTGSNFITIDVAKDLGVSL
jgi:peptidoglycan hydrolase-like protein with peptidoglycan-binding domain